MFGEILKKLRLQRRISQEYIAEKLYVCRQTVSKWEKGLSSPKADQLRSLSRLLDVSPDLLLGMHGEFVSDCPAVSELSDQAQTSMDNCPAAGKKAEMITSIINRLKEMNESGVTALYDFITIYPLKERWMASTSKERIAELDAIEAQREQETAQEKERAAKEAEEKANAKREQIYRDYAGMFNAINKVKMPTRYDLTVGEIQAIDFVCGEVRRFFPEYAYSVAGKYFDYGFVKGMRYAKARAKKKQK